LNFNNIKAKVKREKTKREKRVKVPSKVSKHPDGVELL
jgi:hypothetical protein